MVDISDEDSRRLAALRMNTHCVCFVAFILVDVVHCRESYHDELQGIW